MQDVAYEMISASCISQWRTLRLVNRAFLGDVDNVSQLQFGAQFEMYLAAMNLKIASDSLYSKLRLRYILSTPEYKPYRYNCGVCGRATTSILECKCKTEKELQKYHILDVMSRTFVNAYVALCISLYLYNFLLAHTRSSVFGK